MSQSARPPSPESLLAHREWLRAMARNLVADESAVDDVEQRAWLAVLRNRRPVTSVRAWLRRVVKNAVIDERRATSRRDARETASARPEALASTDDLVAQADSQRAVAEAVIALAEPYRTTVLRRYFEGLTIEQVAARMACPVETVRTRLRRAHALLRDALDREFGDRRAWCLALLPSAKARSPIPIGAATTGALVMAGKTWVAAAVVVVVAGGWIWMDRRDAAPGAGSAVVAKHRDAAIGNAVPKADRRVVTRAHEADAAASADVPTPTPVAARTRVRIHRDDGLSPVGTRVVAWHDDVVDCSGETSADGVADVAACDVARTAVVAAPGHRLVRTTIPAGATECEVVVPAGATVEGVVRVDGLAPREPVELTLSRSDGAEWTPFADLPRAVWHRLAAEQGRWWTNVPAQADADERFAFGGLVAGEGAQIVVPAGYTQRDSKAHPYQFVETVVPAKGVFVDLLRLPRVTGRVVRPGGGPVDGARVVLSTETTDAGGCTMLVTTRADGRFVVSAASFALVSASLSVAEGDGKGERKIAVPVEGLTSRDLGDVPLAAVRSGAVEVRDPSGAAIRGAVAVDATGTLATDAPTDASGHAGIHVWGDAPHLRIGALGYGSAEVDLAAGAVAPLDVVLVPATLLDVEITGDPRPRADAFRLSLDAAGALFETPSGAYDDVAPRVGGASTNAEFSAGGRSAIDFAPEGRSEFRVSGLRPGAAIRLRLFDVVGTVHADQEITLAPGERRRVKLAVPPPRRLALRIADDAGRPVANAWCRVSASGLDDDAFGPKGTSFASDAGGRAGLDDLRTGRVTVCVSAPGCPAWTRAGLEVPASGRDLDVRMETGRMLRVTLRDAKGQAVHEALVRAERASSGADGIALSSSTAAGGDAGRYEIGDCPVGAVVVVVQFDESPPRRFPVAAGADDVALTVTETK